MHHSLLLIFQALAAPCLLAAASSHHHGHAHFHHSHGHVEQRSGNATGDAESAGLQSALRLLAKAHVAMSHANRDIVADPRPNRLEVLNATALQEARIPPQPLDYNAIVNNSTAAPINSRRDLNGTGIRNDTLDGGDPRYTIPEELISAARLVSENWQPPKDDGSYASAVGSLQDRYKPVVEDTQMMPPVLQYASGLQEHVDEPPSAFRYGGNESGTVVVTPEIEDSDSSLQKRAAEDWWMSSLKQRGSSPFSPAGYQVWRNVRDFGAKGDGVADDTAAINRAISSGGRCGSNCTGSTIYPATVYFPPGTYKVSSSIIQYYNTEMIGNPLDLPIIVAAPSFVGLGVITSNVYTGESSQWYLNQNNFLRSVRNFIIDIRATYQDAYVCAIHWQVAQGTSLENIHFYMTKPSDNPKTTQQGIYMENGSGGFLTDLYFIGGHFGAYMGNQQFTASGLYFQDAKTAIQIHWDWGWTMQNILIDSCDTGIAVVGGAGGAQSTGQGVGSLLLADIQIFGSKVGISTSLHADNSTALMIMNSAFWFVDQIVVDADKSTVLLPGVQGEKRVDGWGFGRVSSSKGDVSFLNGAQISTGKPDPSLLGNTAMRGFFNRRRPKYNQIGFAQIIDAKEYGAKGDGQSDDTAILNHLFSTAANMSSIVYMPFGVYLITDTVEIPVGSRIIGQAWSQIMATGSKFQDADSPHVAVRVGRKGQAGVVEIQSLMLTVKGPTAGAIMMEWNVHETTQGSAGLWDTHFRVGGAAGSDLTVNRCPKLSGSVKKECIAASLMLHLTETSSAYLENVWMWTADHDFDTPDQAQIDVFAARGLLIESKGPTWLWGTSVEHCVLYQYQLSGAKNVLMGLIQTESPYFQSVPEAPAPFKAGAFPNDPSFQNCASGSKSCAVSWAVRLIDSSAIHVLSAGLYSFFSRYDQTCLNSGRHDCQDKIFYTEESYDVWVYNLVTLGSIEMMSPLNGVPTLGKPNRNGFASSILAWLGGSEDVTGTRDFEGYRLHDLDAPGLFDFPDYCSNALTALIQCDSLTSQWTSAEYHGVLPEETNTTSVCNPGCISSVDNWVIAVDLLCKGYEWEGGASPTVLGSYVKYGLAEACQKDPKTGKNCNDVIVNFKTAASLEDMPDSELCSDCFVGRLKMMQASPYSIYALSPFYQNALKRAVSRCSLGSQPVAIKASPFPIEAQEVPFCLSGKEYTSQSGDTCDSIALKSKVSSAALFMGNPHIVDCNKMAGGLKLCLPLQCTTYQLQQSDTCVHVEAATGLGETSLRQLNSWIELGCGNLQQGALVLGRVLCTTVPGGEFVSDVTNEQSDPAYSEFADEVVSPPVGSILAQDTTKRCGRWHTVAEGESCPQVLGKGHISLLLFAKANPSVDSENCSETMVVGLTYCVGPTRNFDDGGFVIELPEHYHHGCMAVETGQGTPIMVGDEIIHDTLMTVESCKAFCLSSSFHIFGLQDGKTCLCDAVIRLETRPLDASQCKTKCVGNSKDACGGVSAVDVYSLEEFPKFEARSLGCYVHKSGQQALVTFGFLIPHPEQSRTICGAFCFQEMGTTFFALQGMDCFCGTALTKTAQSVDIDECNTPCPSGDGSTCGGKDRIEIFSSSAPIVSGRSLGVEAVQHDISLPAFYNHGCYKKGRTSGSGLSHSRVSAELGMTLEYCARYCFETQKQSLFGLQGGSNCHCGSQVDVGVIRVADSECSTPCTGDAQQSCGASEQLSLYSFYKKRPLAYRHVGCMKREAGKTVFGQVRPETGVEQLSVRKCAMACAEEYPGQESSLSFSVEGGDQCNCAIDVVFGEITPELCGTPCVGNADEMCGGEIGGNVYTMAMV
ncbi:pectate lyase superfamily protein-domain-containing protein [Plectosphaerella cucumerina]|uniref:Pectate lyase superfamily protein-domain-containing protein n=1 Tax=Plectosphaerella cucumerina TaxID=40658 RepID=A0A8K0TF63_9PEZI|nr:pectate lyase superfamily protein-domain-containing protein [Plectosphaerella cucumerina]